MTSAERVRGHERGDAVMATVLEAAPAAGGEAAPARGRRGPRRQCPRRALDAGPPAADAVDRARAAAGLRFRAWPSRRGHGPRSARVPVLVAARDVAAGEVLTADALPDRGGRRRARRRQRGRGPSRRSSLGQVARGPIPAGTLLSPAMVSRWRRRAGRPGRGRRRPRAWRLPDGHAAGRRSRPARRGGGGRRSRAPPPALGSARVWADHHRRTAPGSPGLFVSLLVPADRAVGGDERRGAASSCASCSWAVRVVIWAVASRKGSPGATTLAVLLARLLARAGRSRGSSSRPIRTAASWPPAGTTVVGTHPRAGAAHAGRRPRRLGGRSPAPARPSRRRRASSWSPARRRRPRPKPRCGRSARPRPAPLARRARASASSTAAGSPRPARRCRGRGGAERVLLVVRPRLDEVVALAPGRRVPPGAGLPLGLVCVGDRPFHPLEVADQAGLPLLGVIADDPVAAALVFAHGLDGRGLRRSRLRPSVAGAGARSAADPLVRRRSRGAARRRATRSTVADR